MSPDPKQQPTPEASEGVRAYFRPPPLVSRAAAEREVRAALKPKPKIPDMDFLTMSPGSAVVIAGVTCKLHNINRGKRRLTFRFGKPIPGATDLTGMQPGSLVKIHGVYCKLERVDQAKGRWAFTPNSPAQVMPVAAMANPILPRKQ